MFRERMLLFTFHSPDISSALNFPTYYYANNPAEMLEAEDKERKQKQAEVDKETERLRKQYGVTGGVEPPKVQFAPPMPPRPQQQQNWSSRPQPFPQYHSAPHTQPIPVQRPLSTPSGPSNVSNATLNTWLQRPQQSGPYLQTPGQGTASSSGFFGLGGKKVQKKRSVFF